MKLKTVIITGTAGMLFTFALAQESQARKCYDHRPRSGFSITFGTSSPGYHHHYYRSPVRYYRPATYYRPVQTRNIYYSVDDVQRKLKWRGYYQDQVDGIYGPNTRRAVRRFQRDAGLRVTGKIDVGTLRRLGIHG